MSGSVTPLTQNAFSLLKAAINGKVSISDFHDLGYQPAKSRILDRSKSANASLLPLRVNLRIKAIYLISVIAPEVS